MRQRLHQAVQELNELTRGLDAKVRERTEELNTINQRLYQSDRLSSLGQLAASVAHEINNPVAGVLNLSMLLQRIVDERGIPHERVQEVRGYLTQIVSETSRVGRIVTDLLTFSRRPSPQRSETDLNVILRRTLSIIDHKLSLMGVELDVRADAQLPPVKCDASQIQQVIVNLVLNAAEATQAKATGRVRVATRHLAKQASVELEVSDNGEGIPREHLGKIFDPFFTTRGEGKGTGLGLAVVYGIVNSHGGEVLVQSEPGEGSTFRVILPLDPGIQPGTAA
jgi:two-component system NtrC family sensor kinase